MDADIPLYFSIILNIILIISLLILVFKRNKDNSEDEIISMVNESTEKGELRPTEANMIHNIFEYDDKDAKDIMVHRGEIIAIDAEEKLKDAVELFKANHISRFPVYDEDLDNIVGMIHMRDLFLFSLDKVNLVKKIKDIPDLMYSPIFVPETHSINTLFTTMQSKKTHLVIVKDEYGQTSGLLTMEDIIEEIFGNIFDEYDKVYESIINRGNDVYIMFGRTELDEVAKSLSLEFEDNDIETLNGFITKEIGHIPKEDEEIKIEYKNYSFEVLKVNDNLIQAVRVKRIS